MVPIIVALMFIVFIGIGLIKNQADKKKAVVMAAAGQNSERFYVHPTHTFALIQSDSTALLGVDEFARKLFGIIHPVSIPQKGNVLKQGEKIWEMTIHNKTRTVSQSAPIDCQVIQVNDNPETFKEWILKVQPLDLTQNLSNLYDSSFISKTYRQVRDLFVGQPVGEFAMAMQDGGELADDFVSHLDDKQLDELLTRFF